MTTTVAIATIVAIVAPLTGVLMLLPRLARPTLPFGVRVPADHTDDPVIRAATRRYYRSLPKVMLVVTVILIALSLAVAAQVIVSSAAIVALAAWLVSYLAARRTILDAKHTEAWFGGKRQAVVSDTTWRTSPPPYPWAWAWPAVAIALATLAIGIAVYPSLPDRIATHVGPDGPDQFSDTTAWTAFGLVGIEFLLTALLLGLVVVVLRSKSDLTAASPEVSAEQYRRYAIAMAKAVLVLAAGMNATMLIAALVIWEVLPDTNAWIIVSVVPALATAAVVVVVAIRTGQSGHRLRATTQAEPAGVVTDRDDDEQWIAGLLYRNHNDPALFVPKRYGGVGWTVNLAHPGAWAIVGLTLLIAIGIPIVAAVAS